MRTEEQKRAYFKGYYIKHTEFFKANRQKSRKLLKDYVIEYRKNHPCLLCGESHQACLQFHHRDPSKKILEIYRIVNRMWSLKRLKQEIEKCDILCANCHFKFHWEERQRKMIK